jgi:hypothetical protein
VTSARRRLRALVGIALYGAIAVALPALHAGVHALGIAHTHGAAHAHHHGSDGATLHADLEALDLHDLVESGGARVDCTLASFTLATGCGDGELATTFAAEALARDDAPASPPPFDPEHGRGAPEHLGIALVGAAPIVAPLPCAMRGFVAQFSVDENPPARFLAAPHARGPPALRSTNS